MHCQRERERAMLTMGIGALCDADCAEPCDEIKYTTQTTFAYFPPAHIGEAYARSFGFNSTEKFRENFLIAEFYVESLVMITVEEVRDMEIIDLISNIGGIVGFYLGETETARICLIFLHS